MTKEEFKRNLEKHDYDYNKIKEELKILKSLVNGLEGTVLDGEKDKDVEYDFYKLRMQANSEILLMKENLDELYRELHLEIFPSNREEMYEGVTIIEIDKNGKRTILHDGGDSNEFLEIGC